MDFSASGGCHQPIDPVPRRSRVSSEPSSELRFSRFFIFIPAAARQFFLGVLALLLILPSTYRVGAVTFAFNGFQESDVYRVPGSPWTFDSNTSCFYFDPPEASWNKSVPGRFLYPDLVQMKDRVTKRVKSFSTTFIYKIQAAHSSTFGPGMSFIAVPDNVTEDFDMGVFASEPSTSGKIFQSNNHSLGVELDTFNDPSDNPVGVNLASMNSTFIVDPVYPSTSLHKDIYSQIWIFYNEANSLLNTHSAFYRESEVVRAARSHARVDLSLLLEDMYIGFSTAKGIESDNYVPYVYAWSFSNDVIVAPSIVIGLNATSAPPPIDVPIAARLEAPPSSSQVLICSALPSGSPPPLSMAIPPSPSNGAPEPTATTKKRKNFYKEVPTERIMDFIYVWRIMEVPTERIMDFIYVWGIMVSICVEGIWLLCWSVVFRRPLRIFISHTGGGEGKNFPTWLHWLHQSLMSHNWSSRKFRVKIFLDVSDCQKGIIFKRKFFEELTRFDVGIMVITNEYFESGWPLIELLAFVEAQKKDPRNRIHIIPLFYGLTPEELKARLQVGSWEDSWKNKAEGTHSIEVEKYRKAVIWLSNARGILYNSQRGDNDKTFIDTICKEVDKILCKERSFTSSIRWAMITMLERIATMICTGTKKGRKHANERDGKEIKVMIYINKLLRLLFAFSGLFIILLSVILDNSFNDKPVRFIAFVILAPIMIFLGFLASGWFPGIPLWFIAFVKRRGFLQQVVPCCPWHDNIVTNFCGKICTLEPMEQGEGTRLLELPMLAQNFLYGDQFSPQRTTHTIYPHSILNSNSSSDLEDCQEATSPLEIQGQDVQEVSTLNAQSQDFKTSNVLNQAFMSEILEHPHVVMSPSQLPSPNLQEDLVVEIDHSFLIDVFGDEQNLMLEFEGPKINGFPLKIQVSKNMLTRNPTFDLFYTFRNKNTRRMNLTTKRLSNLVQNMCQWVEIPYPIVVNESCAILHCMSIQDILWAFTKGVYTFNSVLVQQRYLAGMEMERSIVFLSLTLVTLMMSIIPLVWDKKSYWFLLFMIVMAIYVLKTKYISYYFRSFFCPIYLKYKDFRRLYKSKSSLIWCNEFRKKKIVNPESFWIDQEYANELSDTDSCFNTGESVILPGNPFRGESFKIACEGWPEDDPKKQHDYELELNFNTFNPGDTNYTKVKLSFFENGDLLGTRKYSSVEIQRLQLIEKLFFCYSNPSFGGYVETIRQCSWSRSYLGNCCRFLDICNKIIRDSRMPFPSEAATKCNSQFIIGVPF